VFQVVPANGDGQALGSLAFFDPAQSVVSDAIASSGGTATGLNTLQTAVYSAEREFWSGATQNPSETNTDNNGYGVANLITERSVIGSFPFLSRFNTGAGDQFFVDGKSVSQVPWFNMGNQDILPTWQWWTKDYNSNATPSGLLSADYDLSSAWNGGSSLKVSGQLGPNNPTELRLFKTKLAVPSDSEHHRLGLTYKLDTSGASNLYVGLILEDNPKITEWVGVGDCEYHHHDDGRDEHGDSDERQVKNRPLGNSGWSQALVSLRPYAGRTIAAISVGFKVDASVTTASAYAINVGEIALLHHRDDPRNNAQCKTPNNFAMERLQISADGKSAQLRLTWDFDSEVWYYDIYRRQVPHSRKNMIWLGRITCDCYYVDSVPRIRVEKSAVVQLVTVASNGRENVSEDATVKFTWV